MNTVATLARYDQMYKSRDTVYRVLCAPVVPPAGAIYLDQSNITVDGATVFDNNTVHEGTGGETRSLSPDDVVCGAREISEQKRNAAKNRGFRRF